MDDNGIQCANYLTPVANIKELPKTVNRLVRKLKPHKDKFDTIAFRGLSGALIAPLLAMRMKKEILAVRKQDQTHSCHCVEGNKKSEAYIIIDDLVASGNTLKAIKQAIQSERIQSKCVGVALYFDHSMAGTETKIKECFGEDVFIVNGTKPI